MKLLVFAATMFVLSLVVATGAVVFGQTATPTNSPTPTTSVTSTMTPTPTGAVIPSGAPATGRGGY